MIADVGHSHLPKGARDRSPGGRAEGPIKSPSRGMLRRFRLGIKGSASKELEADAKEKIAATSTGKALHLSPVDNSP